MKASGRWLLWQVKLSLVLALTVSSAYAGSTTDPLRPDTPPEVVRTPAGSVEVGRLNGVPYRIDVPAVWNHELIVFYHGYSEGPYTYRTNAPLNEQTEPMFSRGYAVIQSGYSTWGWALAEAYPESEQLRRYFLKEYADPTDGKPTRSIDTFVVGGSMGGALVSATLELNPKPYQGGLNLCGSVGPTDLAFQRRFAWRAAFDFYFPGLLPPLVLVPSNFQETTALRLRLEVALTANPPAAAAMRNLTGLHSDKEVAAAMPYFTYVIMDMQHRSGGNPFDNRNYLYTGTNPASTASDNALNDGVHRYAGDPHARTYMLHYYSPSGRLARPMLSLHTTYDPRIPGSTLTVYAEEVAQAGFAENLVQQYVHRDGHCTFTAEEIGRAFDELVTWTRAGRRPTPGLLGGVPPAARTMTTDAIH